MMSILFLVFSVCSDEGKRHLTQKQQTVPSLKYLKHEILLSCSDCFAKFVQLNVANLFDCTPRCFAEHVGYPCLSQIVDDGIGAISILQLIH